MLAQPFGYVNTALFSLFKVIFQFQVLCFGFRFYPIPYSPFPIPFINDPSKLTSELYT